MIYQWDSRKDSENRRKHGLALADGIQALEDPDALFWIDNRFDYEEERIVNLGITAHGILYVVTTETAEDSTRIISVRKAEAHEEDWYYQGRP